MRQVQRWVGVWGSVVAGALGCSAAPMADRENLDQMGCSGCDATTGDDSPLGVTSGEFTELSPSPSNGETQVCAAEVVEAQLLPVNLFLMVDRSGSMVEHNKWQQATGALRRFLQDPATQGLRVALRFFSDDAPMAGCTMQGCNVDACAEPLVDVGTLGADGGNDGQAARLVAALDGTFPRSGLGTPIYPALGGALKWAGVYQSEHPAEKAVVVLVTDGEPNGCNQEIRDISALAADAHAAFGVPTYAIGLQGSNEAQLDEIARAGATQRAIFVGASQDAEAELTQALDSIRGETMSCDFAVPRGADDRPADSSRVNVTLSDQTSAVPLFQVDGKGDCGGEHAWYYDDPQAPGRIHLCPSACQSAANAGSSIEIELGCVATRRSPLAVR